MAEDSPPGSQWTPARGFGREASLGQHQARCPVMVAADDDESAAAEARARYRVGPMAAIEPDPCIGPFLRPGERVVATRPELRIDQMPAGSGGPTVTGRLYVTSCRILHLSDAGPLAFDLDAIEDAGVGGDELLLAFRGGRSAVLHTERPRLLRVEIAAARAVARREAESRADETRRAGRPDHDRSR